MLSNPYLLSESRYEIIQTDLNRKVGIFEKRGKFSALSDGKQFSSLMILTMTEKVLSIFIDESGRFQYPDDKSRFYIISMVMHDQTVDITQEVSNLEQGFRSLHLSNLCFHAGPLIRQEKIFAVMDWEFRSRIFSMMMAFARKVDFKYHCLTVDKKFITSAEMLVQKLHDGLDEFLTSQRSEMSLYDKVKIYYDCGQSPLTNLLHRAFEGKYGPRIEFAQAVKPERYRLFQLADLVCSLKLIELRLASGGTMTESEYTFFGGPKAFKHNILRRIKRKEI